MVARHPASAITLGYYAHFIPEAGSRGGQGTDEQTAIDGLLGSQGDPHVGPDIPDFPRAGDGRFLLFDASTTIMNCKVNGVGGLRKC